MARYAYKLAGLCGDTDPQEIGDYLEQLIEASEENLGKEEILADAAKVRSPLHKAFEWSDATAAEKHRQRQVTTLMKNLSLAKKSTKEASKTRAFVYVSHPQHEGRRVYLSVKTAMNRPEFKAQVVEQAVASLNRWLNFYGPQLGQRKMLVRDVERLRGKIERELMAAL